MIERVHNESVNGVSFTWCYSSWKKTGARQTHFVFCGIIFSRLADIYQRVLREDKMCE